MFGDHGLCGLLEEGAHEKFPKCPSGNLGDFGEFCKGLRPRPKPRPNARLLQLQNRQTQPGPHRQPPSRRRLCTRQNAACNPRRRSGCRNRRWRTGFSGFGRNQPDRQRLGTNVGFSLDNFKDNLNIN